jgi:hypothetical protein
MIAPAAGVSPAPAVERVLEASVSLGGNNGTAKMAERWICKPVSHTKGLATPNCAQARAIVTQIQVGSSRPDSAVRVRYAQPCSPSLTRTEMIRDIRGGRKEQTSTGVVKEAAGSASAEAGKQPDHRPLVRRTPQGDERAD